MKQYVIHYWAQSAGPYHIPGEVCHPVDGWVDSADELQVLAVGHALLDEVQHEAGRDERHGEDHTDRHHHVDEAVRSERTN